MTNTGCCKDFLDEGSVGKSGSSSGIPKAIHSTGNVVRPVDFLLIFQNVNQMNLGLFDSGKTALLGPQDV